MAGNSGARDSFCSKEANRWSAFKAYTPGTLVCDKDPKSGKDAIFMRIDPRVDMGHGTDMKTIWGKYRGEWKEDTKYGCGHLVKKGGKVYISNAANNKTEPKKENPDWVRFIGENGKVHTDGIFGGEMTCGEFKQFDISGNTGVNIDDLPDSDESDPMLPDDSNASTGAMEESIMATGAMEESTMAIGAMEESTMAIGAMEESAMATGATPTTVSAPLSETGYEQVSVMPDFAPLGGGKKSRKARRSKYIYRTMNKPGRKNMRKTGRKSMRKSVRRTVRR